MAQETAQETDTETAQETATGIETRTGTGTEAEIVTGAETATAVTGTEAGSAIAVIVDAGTSNNNMCRRNWAAGTGTERERER